MGFYDKQSLLVDNVHNGTISGSDFYSMIVDPVGFSGGKLMQYMSSGDAQASTVVAAVAVASWFKDYFSSYDVLRDSLVSLYSINTDLKGYGALYIQRSPCSFHSGFYDYSYNYCDYILLHSVSSSNLVPYMGALANRTYITVIVCGYDNSSKEVTRNWQKTHVGYDGSINPGSYPECIGLYGDVCNADGSPSDVGQDDSTDVYPDETYNVGELPDGTQVSINDLLGTDGTIDGDIVDLYLDLFDEEAVNDLIDRLIDALDRVGSVTDSSDLVDSVIDDVGDVPLELEGLDGLMVPTSVAHVFPFCLPWDFVQGMYLFKADPEVPKFSFNIEVPSFLGVPEQHWNIDIDFSQFETLAKITRWGFMVLFVYTLILLTGKIVKGAGA